MQDIRMLAIAVALAAGMASAAAAQAPQGQTQDDRRSGEARRGEGRRAARADTGHVRDGRRMRGKQAGLLRGIELSQAQRDEVQAIHAKYRPQLQALRERAHAARGDSAANRDAVRTQARELMDRQRAELRAVLTPEQRQTFDRNVERMREWAQRRADKGEKRRPRDGR